MTGKRRATKPPRRHAATPVSDSVAPVLSSSPPNGAVGTALLSPPQPTRPSTRREDRARRKQAARRRRNLALVGVGAVALVAVLGIAAYTLFGGGGSGPTTPAGTRSQQTLTMVVASSGAPAAAGALMATGGSSTSSPIVLIPSRLLVDGPTPDPIPFASTTQLPSTDAPGFALAQTLDVLVDGTWRLSPTGLAKLVDAVGGVNVTVDSDLIVKNSKGQQVVAIPAGTTKLNGAQAATYATVIPADSTQAARLVHFNDVWTGLLDKLPTNSTDVAKLLGQLGGTSVSTQSTTWLAGFLASLAAANQQGNSLSQTLPVSSLDVGGGSATFTVDSQGWQQISSTAFAESQPPGGTDRPRVLVQNGVGSPGLVESAAHQLTAGGFEFINGGNANSFGHAKTVIVVPDSGAPSMQLGQSVASALGLSTSAVQVAGDGQTVADVIVVLGADYKP